MSLRLFAALDLPDETAARLAPLQRGVAGAKWRPRQALHLTLRFFGNLNERLAEELDLELGAIRVAPFELTLKGVGWFGRDRPSNLWVGAEASPLLAALAQACERAARRAGLEPERRTFTPHVTLAYCKGTQAEDAARFAQRLALFETDAFLVDRFFLYSSWQTKGANTYVPEAEYPLAA